MNEALEFLKNRGFFSQCTDEKSLSEKMDRSSLSFYVGCDPTGKSLHIGHMVPFFALRHLKSFGHKAIALVGGGTARIGDPSGKSEMRKMISYDEIDENVKKITAQLDRFIGFDGKTALIADNKDWLSNLNYIDFLREIGSHFSVNKMLSFEAYKQRLQRGLSFIEFNYQLLQSYDFLVLHQKYGVSLQIGGDDQWGNITAGVDLIRRKLGGTAKDNALHECFGLTFPLIMRSDGKKMGKSERGAIFLDENLTSVYDFFQYWRNVPDNDVKKFFLLFTFLKNDEIEKICAQDINSAKERLAFEVTSEIHGKEAANKAMSGARAAFGGAHGEKNDMPTKKILKSQIEMGIGIIDLFDEAKMGISRSEIRRILLSGGASVNGKTFTDPKTKIQKNDASADGDFILRCGKKKIVRIIVE